MGGIRMRIDGEEIFAGILVFTIGVFVLFMIGLGIRGSSGIGITVFCPEDYKVYKECISGVKDFQKCEPEGTYRYKDHTIRLEYTGDCHKGWTADVSGVEDDYYFESELAQEIVKTFGKPSDCNPDEPCIWHYIFGHENKD